MNKKVRRTVFFDNWHPTDRAAVWEYVRRTSSLGTTAMLFNQSTPKFLINGGSVECSNQEQATNLEWFIRGFKAGRQ